MLLLNLLALAITGGEPTITESKIVGVSMFKNGYAVVVREAKVKSGEVLIENPGYASLGSIWLNTSKGAHLENAVSMVLKKAGSRPVNSLDEVLAANIEKNVTLETLSQTTNQTSIVKGRLLSADGGIVVIEGENDRMALTKSSILRIVSSDHGLVFRVPTEEQKRVIKARVKGDGSLYLVSMQHGMTWAPSYQFALNDDKTATLLAKATILNDLGKLEDITVNLVTGFPNVRYINILDPFTSGANLDQFIGSMGEQLRMGFEKADSLTQNALGSGGGGFGAPSAPVASPGDLIEDLFFYRKSGISLDPGERGYYELFQAKTEYQSIYSASIPIDSTLGRSQQPENRIEVWHTLKFKNSATQPLTTAPVTISKQGETLGQDLLNYTSTGAETTIKVTKALDVVVEANEEEKDRERKVLVQEGRSSYDRALVETTIEVRNLKSKPVTIEINKMIIGEVSKAEEATVKKLAEGLKQLNPVSNLSWTFELKPGESKKLLFQYKVFVPSFD